MGIDLARTFVIENEWYWRINENATSLTLEAALRDVVAPLVRLLKSHAPAELRPGTTAFDFVLGDVTTSIALTPNATDRVTINHLVGDVNRALSNAKLGLAFALVVPRRYELRGALLTEEELTRLAGDPIVLVPSSRPSWKAIPVPAT